MDNNREKLVASYDNFKKWVKKNKARSLIMLLVSLALITLIMLLVYKSGLPQRDDPLIGTWNYDEVTKYQFGADGNGALILPDNTYDFTYIIDEGKLYIDFANESAADRTYDYEVSGGKLILTGDENTASGTYELTKDNG